MTIAWFLVYLITCYAAGLLGLVVSHVWAMRCMDADYKELIEKWRHD